MTRRIAVFAQNFNPPTTYDAEVAQALSDLRDPFNPEDTFFEEILIVPSGLRPGKASIEHVTSLDRAAMVDLGFQGIPRCRVDLFDLEHQVYTSNIQFLERYSDLGEVWQVVHEDVVRQSARERSSMERTWISGQELWERGRFIVLTEELKLASRFYPPTSRFLQITRKIPRGAVIRGEIFHEERWQYRDWLVSGVAQYIRSRRLYQGPNLANPYRAQLDVQQPLLVTDDDGDYRNPKTAELRDALGLTSAERLTEASPTCVIVLGGDGTMMRAIRKHWRLRVPFIGINAGHRGFHLNQPPEQGPRSLFAQPLEIYQFPMLTVRWKDPQGEWHETNAYQDAWIQQAYSTVWISMYENDRCRYERLVADAALVALPVGSTGYARAMGAQACPLTVPQLTFAAACFNDHSVPSRYTPRTMSIDTEVSFKNLQPGRRSPMAIADGVPLGIADEMRIRVSRVASALVAYPIGHDFSDRLR